MFGVQQYTAHSFAHSRRSLVRYQQRTSRKSARAAVARSTLDRAQVDDDTVSLDSLQNSFDDSPHQPKESGNGNTEVGIATRHTAVLKASKQHKHLVQEKQRPLGECELC